MKSKDLEFDNSIQKLEDGRYLLQSSFDLPILAHRLGIPIKQLKTTKQQGDLGSIEVDILGESPRYTWLNSIPKGQDGMVIFNQISQNSENRKRESEERLKTLYTSMVNRNYTPTTPTIENTSKIETSLPEATPVGTTTPEKKPWNLVYNIPGLATYPQQQTTTPQETTTQEQPVTPTGPSNGRYTDRQKFASDIYQSYLKHGLSPDAAKTLTALSVLESGWGKYVTGHYNYGGVKDFSKDRTTNGSIQMYDKVAKSNDYYRSYSSMDDYTAKQYDMLKRLYLINGQETAAELLHKLTSGENPGRKKYNGRPTYTNSVMSVYNSLTV